jgi:hypothetical protein
VKGAAVRSLALLLALATASPQPTAAQQPSAVQWHAEYRIEVDGPTRVCKGVAVEYVVRVIRYGVAYDARNTVYLDWGEAATTLHVAADGRSSPFRTSAGRGTTYRQKFTSVGTHTLTFSADFHQIVVGVGSYSLAPLTIQVEVVDCTYNVTTLSVWIMPIGFRPWMGEVMQKVTLIPTTPEGPDYRGDGTLKGVPIPQVHINCAVTMTASPVEVTLQGLAGFVRDIRTSFQLDLSYGPGSVGAAGTAVTCPYVSGGTSDTFSLAPLHQLFPPEGGAILKPHVMHADRIGDILGRTVIVVTQGTEP